MYSYFRIISQKNSTILHSACNWKNRNVVVGDCVIAFPFSQGVAVGREGYQRSSSVFDVSALHPILQYLLPPHSSSLHEYFFWLEDDKCSWGKIQTSNLLSRYVLDWKCISYQLGLEFLLHHMSADILDYSGERVHSIEFKTNISCSVVREILNSAH